MVEQDQNVSGRSFHLLPAEVKVGPGKDWQSLRESLLRGGEVVPGSGAGRTLTCKKDLGAPRKENGLVRLRWEDRV